MSALTYSWRHLIVGDVKYYAKKRRWVAMVRSVAWRVVGWDSETCQDCGRRYSWSHWVSASELYVRVKGNGGGTFCPRCFGKMAEAKGMRLLWTPIPENRRTVHGDIMDGHLIFRPLALRRFPPSSSAPTPEPTFSFRNIPLAVTEPCEWGIVNCNYEGLHHHQPPKQEPTFSFHNVPLAPVPEAGKWTDDEIRRLSDDLKEKTMNEVQLTEFLANPKQYVDEVAASGEPITVLQDYDVPVVVISKP